MRGFPKHLNTKDDYMNCLTEFPTETKAELQRLLDSRYVWQDEQIIEASRDVAIKEDQRIIEEDGIKIIQKKIEDSNAEIFELGFTVAEVEDLIKND